jgi:hypothetical protein
MSDTSDFPPNNPIEEIPETNIQTKLLEEVRKKAQLLTIAKAVADEAEWAANESEKEPLLVHPSWMRYHAKIKRAEAIIAEKEFIDAQKLVCPILD